MHMTLRRYYVSPLARVSFAFSEAICLYCVIRFLIERTIDKVLLSVCVAALAAVPLWITRFSIFPADWLTVFVHLYALGVLFGHNFDFYDRVGCWDKLLHAAGGITFAIVGQYVLYFLNRRQPSPRWLTFTFMLISSIAAAAIWEFYEYFCDRAFHLDMQRDTYLTDMYSRLLADAYGEIGSIDPIESITVNSVKLSGYIDVGLIDTMNDMLTETLGAIAAAVGFLIGKDHRPAVRFPPKDTVT